MAPQPMICFIDPARRFTLATNYKVMYSTLLAQSQLTVAHDRSELERLLRDQTPRITQHYLLVRNPYDRLLSFYADKFQAHPPGADDATIQGSHRIFFDLLGVAASAGADRAAAFRNTGFERFVELLTPALIVSNVHLVPQSTTLAPPRGWRERRALGGLWRPGRVLKMERDLETLRSLGIDIEVRINATPHGSATEVYTPASYSRATDLYRQDFERFEYPTWRPPT